MLPFIASFVIYHSNAQSLQMPLRQAAEQSNLGIFVGTAMNYKTLNKDNEYASFAAEQYNLITSEGGCKFAPTQPEYNVFNFTECDYNYNYALKHNMTFRGHNFVWGAHNPSWLTQGNYSSEQLQQILNTHITTVLQHYDESPGVYSWDVVNEVLMSSPGLYPNIYKDNVWYPKVKNYVFDAFTYADKARKDNSINVKLFYNEWDIHYINNKSNAVYQMIQHMQALNISIDGLGIEHHLSIDSDYPLDYNKLVVNMKRFVDLGLEIHITEMDIACGNFSKNTTCNYTHEVEVQQAEMFQTVLQACIAFQECKSFETWGYTDKYTWKGTVDHPLPWDVNYKPKPAAFYIENAFLNQTVKRPDKESV